MIRVVQRFIATTAAFLTGCVARPVPPTPPAAGRVVVVPGVFGDGPWYDGLREALADGGFGVSTFVWGLPKPLFVGNFGSAGVHEKAEADFATELDAAGPVDVVAHSAGCGVVLGALAECRHVVGRVVLIAPSVSPDYDLRAALAHCDRMDVFYSARDTFFLKWRCGTFGTYDRVRTPAAGYGGFAVRDPKLTQHAYDPAWNALGNDGGHGGATAGPFVRRVVLPLLAAGDQPW